MPNLAASAVVTSEDGVLLVKRRDVETWVLPGGLVDPGETLAHAAVRETREETGLSIELSRLVGVYSAPNWHSGGDHVIVFSGKPVGGTLQPQESEALETGFFAPEQLPSPMAWWHEDRIRDALSGIGGSVARLQDMVWPFEPDTDRRALSSRIEQSGLTKSQFYTEHFSRRGPDDGRIEVAEIRHE